MKSFTVIINGVPVGSINANSIHEARLIARGDPDLNEDNAPMDYIWAEED